MNPLNPLLLGAQQCSGLFTTTKEEEEKKLVL